MPSTCQHGESQSCGKTRLASAAEFVPKSKTYTVEGVIEHFIHGRETTLLHSCVLDSLTNIHGMFFSEDAEPCRELEVIRRSVQHASQHTLLAIFFLLLNVEKSLKERIFSIEVKANHAKLARFLMDLRNTVVTGFFTDERKTTLSLVEACEDCYILA